MKKLFTSYKNDIVLFIILLSAGIILLLTLFIFSRHGSFVIIRVNGEIADTINLSDDCTREINTYGHNTICISNGQVYMKEADCPDRLCMHVKPINKTGQTIICLPHKLTIEIESQSPDSIIDAVSE